MGSVRAGFPWGKDGVRFCRGAVSRGCMPASPGGTVRLFDLGVAGSLPRAGLRPHRAHSKLSPISWALVIAPGPPVSARNPCPRARAHPRKGPAIPWSQPAFQECRLGQAGAGSPRTGPRSVGRYPPPPSPAQPCHRAHIPTAPRPPTAHASRTLCRRPIALAYGQSIQHSDRVWTRKDFAFIGMTESRPAKHAGLSASSGNAERVPQGPPRP